MAEPPGEVPASAHAARVDPVVELALILVALGPLGLSDPGYEPVHRRGDYYRDVLDHFGSFREHPAVTRLGADFSLPRLVGNAADFRFDARGNLVEAESFGSLWGDREGDLFRRHLVEIGDFARVSDVQGFLRAQAPLHRRIERITEERMGLAHMATWLEGQFSARPGPAQVFLSPLLGGHHWAGGGPPAPLRIWNRPPRDLSSGSGAAPDAVERMLYMRSLFTELDHPYVNPASTLHREAIEAALLPHAPWANARAWASYSSAELVFNEYMTYAVFLLYAREHFPADPGREVRERTLQHMQTRRGFLRFEAFADELLRLADEREEPAEALLGELIAWCAAQDD